MFQLSNYKYNYYKNVTNCNGLQLQITINYLHGNINILHKLLFLLVYSLLLNLLNLFELSHLILAATLSYSQCVSQYPAAQENNNMISAKVPIFMDHMM